MLFSGKENVFMCLVVFQKISRKIFFGVWKMLQGKDKPKKTRTKPRLTLDARWVRRRGASQALVRRPRRRSRSREALRRFARSRSTLCEIAIGAKARARSMARSREASIVISAKARLQLTARSREAPRRSRSAQWRDRDLGSRSTALEIGRAHV